ncbi:hypothetical protein BOTBODRAFT_34718 [Botryobasidium botryosum FD-172 SS1]|uniref:Protein kinase domain-containing protein n=1 Tax=Botryobasidium botryosum (strain FD-172 SS1) TaxID=930990 RepID=A0A067M950_BOTB1|nr:hypothetical protein BOTBODRAFT_34718 [Botryobasidium botryosum FD-172 SS1]
MAASSLSAHGGTGLADRYLVGRVLHQGESSVVLEGWDRETDEKVEIKYVEGHSVSFKDSKEELMVKLHHPNLLNYIARYEEDDGIYYVREHADGGNLKELFSAHQAYTPCVSEEEIKYLAYQICLGLQYAHSQGVIHCDVKPENILLMKNGQVKITGFCLLKDELKDPDSRLKASQIGTLGYKALETFHSRFPEEMEFAIKADSYGAGATILFMLLGEENFYKPSGSLYDAVWQRILSRGIASLGMDFVAELLARNPLDRLSVHQMIYHPWLFDLPVSRPEPKPFVTRG